MEHRRADESCPDQALTWLLLRELPESREARRFRRHARRCPSCALLLEDAAQADARDDADMAHPDALDLAFFIETPEGDPARRHLEEHFNGCSICRERLLDLVDGRRLAATQPVTRYEPSVLWKGRRWVPLLRPVPKWLAFAGLVIAAAVGVSRHERGWHVASPAPGTAESRNSPSPILSDRIVSVYANGSVSVLAAPRIATRIRETLAGGSAALPPIWAEPPEVLRGVAISASSNPSLTPSLLEPQNTVVLGPGVTFRWKRAGDTRVKSHTLQVRDCRETNDVQVFRHVRAENAHVTLKPGHTYIWTVIAFDHEDIAIGHASAWVGVAPGDIADVIRSHPNDHLAAGLLYESISAFEEALSEYRKLTPGPHGAEYASRLIRRAQQRAEQRHAQASAVGSGS
jgi:hypothetical protein